jgi:cell division septal protein FtsQ
MSGSVVRGPMPPMPAPASGSAAGLSFSAAAGGGVSGALGSGARVLDFRRRGVPPRRRRRNPLLLLLRPLGAALLLVLLPLGLAAWVLTSRRFQLQEIEIEGGTPRVPAEWVRGALAPCLGRNLVHLSLAETAALLRRNPWIDTVELGKELPGRLRVVFTERRPVALLRSGGRLVYADDEGRSITPVAAPEEARRDGLLEVLFAHPVSGGVAGALDVAGELGRVRPDWAAALTQIEVLGDEDFRLHTEALPFPVLVTRGQVGAKARRLEELLPELERRYPVIESVDLRFSRRIVVQPGAPVRAAAVRAGAQT